MIFVCGLIYWNKLQVFELPPKAELIAWSDKTGVEMFKYGDHMMGIQGHPEYTKDILLNLIDRIVKLDYITVSRLPFDKCSFYSCFHGQHRLINGS